MISSIKHSHKIIGKVLPIKKLAAVLPIKAIALPFQAIKFVGTTVASNTIGDIWNLYVVYVCVSVFVCV